MSSKLYVKLTSVVSCEWDGEGEKEAGVSSISVSIVAFQCPHSVLGSLPRHADINV